MLRWLRVISAAAVVFLLGVPATNASIKDCNTVDRLALVDYDPSLSVTTVRNREDRTCTFYVELGSSSASAVFRELTSYRTEVALADALKRTEFSSMLIGQLLKPVNDKTFGPLLAQTYQAVIEESREYLEKCVYMAVLSQMAVQPVSPAISCGVPDGSGEFIVMATVEGASVSVSIPFVRT